MAKKQTSKKACNKMYPGAPKGTMTMKKGTK